ncbi:MAG: hypothetical protein JO047_13110 [Alphaproteobacteria bacterium]|nr:hypothetical protein [Alphaproteobacteria bacterium]
MSDIPADLNLREQINRIDHLREEALKFAEETHKLAAEERKLAAEAAKLEREHRLLPWTFLVALTTGVGLGVVQLLAHVAGWWR